MTTGKLICLLLLSVAVTRASPFPQAAHNEGRKLFGGYRIVPKACQPTIPSRIKSNEPAICMFNYECSRRNGEVVGACMDGFLFGACCQLPAKNSMADEPTGETSLDDLLNLHEIDRVPEIPILLNPDGSPIGGDSTKTGDSNHLNSNETPYLKISTISANSPTTPKPRPVPPVLLSSISHPSDDENNAEKTQLPPQADISQLEDKFPILLGHQTTLDDLRLPGLLSHQDANNDVHESHDSAVNPVTTLLSPDQILQIADPVDQLPALFSQGLGQNVQNSADTILLNENGTLLHEIDIPVDSFKPSPPSFSSFTKKTTPSDAASPSKGDATSQTMTTAFHERVKINTTDHGEDPHSTQWIRFPDRSTEPTVTESYEDAHTVPMTKLPNLTQQYANSQRLTTPPSVSSSHAANAKPASTTQERVSVNGIAQSTNALNEDATTPMPSSSDGNDDLVRVPTINSDMQSGNKKNDILDKEEIAINHIISILNNTSPGVESPVTIRNPTSPVHTWVSIDETSKPSHHVKLTSRHPSSTTEAFPYTFYRPSRPSTYYVYDSVPTETTFSSYGTSNSYPSRPSTQGTYGPYSSYSSGYSTRPTTNPPAPTVIVLGPLGTEFTTDTTQKAITRGPSTNRPTILVNTKKPNVSTTITHNISISTGSVSSNNTKVVSTSFITVNLKDPSNASPTKASIDNTGSGSLLTTLTTKRPTIWTTISSWASKPSFHPKPSTENLQWSDDNITPINTIIIKDQTAPTEITTTVTKTTAPCEEETAPPDDLVNFPPVRNPNLNVSTPISQQEKPTLIGSYNNSGYPEIDINDIPTPTFVEDDVLTNKVDVFVNKIVESLQGNFQILKDVVYNGQNITTISTLAPTVITKRPSVPTTTRKPVRKPAGSTLKPGQVTTKRPSSTRKPTVRPTTGSQKPGRPSKPISTRPRPTTGQGLTTKKPQATTKRPAPQRRPTTVSISSTQAVLVDKYGATPAAPTTQTTSTTAYQPPDFRTQCGVRPLIKSGRIVGGKGATFGEWPWQVLIREATWLGLFTKNKCGGVLITSKYVITAAHCQPGFLATLVAVFGEFDLSGELESKRSVTRNVRRVIVNRGYDPATFENDLALLELESPVQFDAHIVPICMPNDNEDFTGRLATVTGWGRLKYSGGVPSVLQEVQVPVMENSVCQEMFQTAGHSKLILDSFLCAGYANGQKDSCEGDSGGPLVMERPDGRWELVGTVSHGIKCAAPYLPGVYMRTTFFKPWLHSITGV